MRNRYIALRIKPGGFPELQQAPKDSNGFVCLSANFGGLPWGVLIDPVTRRGAAIPNPCSETWASASDWLLERVCTAMPV